jgi:hypothetical protein
MSWDFGLIWGGVGWGGEINVFIKSFFPTNV